jgi:hypothetical protein
MGREQATLGSSIAAFVWPTSNAASPALAGNVIFTLQSHAHSARVLKKDEAAGLAAGNAANVPILGNKLPGRSIYETCGGPGRRYAQHRGC